MTKKEKKFNIFIEINGDGETETQMTAKSIDEAMDEIIKNIDIEKDRYRKGE